MSVVDRFVAFDAFSCHFPAVLKSGADRGCGVLGTSGLGEVSTHF